MSVWSIAMYLGIGLALSFAGFRIGELRMRDRILDFVAFFADYLREGNARFLPGTDPAALLDELGKALEEEI